MTTQETAQQDVNGTVLTDEQAPLLKPTPEQIAEYLSGASHDELKSIPTYNERFQKIISDANTEAEQIREKARKEQQDQDNLGRWDQYFSGLTSGDRAKALEDPRNAQAWAALQQRRNPGPVDVNQVRHDAIGVMMEAFATDLSRDPAYVDFEWDKFRNEPSPTKAIRTLVDHGTAGVLKEGSLHMKEEAEAAVNEALAKRGMSRVQPDVLPSTGADSGMTYEGLKSMSETERREFRKKDSALYDSIISKYGDSRRR